MTITKQSAYKLDFSYTHKFSDPAIGERKYPVSDIVKYTKSWNQKKPVFLRDIHQSYINAGKEDEFWAFADLNSVAELNYLHRADVRVEVEKELKRTDLDPNLDSRTYTYSFGYYINKLAHNAALKTLEFQEAEKGFQKWLKRRQGVAQAWKTFVDDHNNKKVALYQKANPLPEELTLLSYVEEKNDKDFRRVLEISRPNNLFHGNIVRLKAEYINTRGNDPFYWAVDPTLRKTGERIGTVVDRENTLKYGNIGVGSRKIKVLWFATGEETSVMERALKIESTEEESETSEAENKL